MAEIEHEESKASCIRGYHIYKNKWRPVNGEELKCVREPLNVIDRYAVAVMKDVTCVAGKPRTVTVETIVIGHLPRKISRIASLFICWGGKIICIVTGRRRRSTDLIQGGLEVPCQLIFISKLKKELEKTTNLL